MHTLCCVQVFPLQVAEGVPVLSSLQYMAAISSVFIRPVQEQLLWLTQAVVDAVEGGTAFGTGVPRRAKLNIVSSHYIIVSEVRH